MSQTSWTQRGPQQDIIMKRPKVKGKERILKAAKEKETVTYKGVPIRLSADYGKFSSFPKGNLQARRDWQEVLKEMKRT